MNRLVSAKHVSGFGLPDVILSPIRALFVGHLKLIAFTAGLAVPVWFSALLFGKVITYVTVSLFVQYPLAAKIISVALPATIWLIASHRGRSARLPNSWTTVVANGRVAAGVRRVSREAEPRSSAQAD